MTYVKAHRRDRSVLQNLDRQIERFAFGEIKDLVSDLAVWVILHRSFNSKFLLSSYVS